MGNSSTKDKQKITPRDRAILDLKVQRDRLKQYQKKIIVVVGRETEIAKEQLRVGNKSLALLALKKKRYQENLLESTGAQLLNLEQLTSNIEFAQVEIQVLQGLRQGNAVLAELQKEVSLEEVEKLMAETAEAIAYQNQISEMLSGKFTLEDEEDLEAELFALQNQAVTVQLGENLPVIPETEPVLPIQSPIMERRAHQNQPLTTLSEGSSSDQKDHDSKVEPMLAL